MHFVDYVIENLTKPFEWGKNDCVLFANNWVKEATGKDFVEAFLDGRPMWSNEREALRLLKDLGGVEEVVNTRLTRINPNLARDGDVALHDRSLCLFSGAYVVGPGETGLIRVLRTEAKCAWSTY